MANPRKRCHVPECRFTCVQNMTRVIHEERLHLCQDCSNLFLRIRDHVCPLQGQRLADRGPRDIDLGPFHERESALLGVVKLYSLVPQQHYDDLHQFYDEIDVSLGRLLTQVVRHWQGVRLQFFLYVHLVNPFTEEEKETFIASDSVTVPTTHRIDFAVIQSAVHQIETLNQIVEKGSMWALNRILRLDVAVGEYNPLRIGCRFTLPRHFRRRKGILSLASPSNLCFQYAVAAAIKNMKGRNKGAVKYYKKLAASFIVEGLSTPILIEEIPKFEKMNNIRVHVHALEESGPKKREFPLRISKLANYKYEVDLLLIGERIGIHHWATITNFNLFMAKYNKGTHRAYFCRVCYNHFSSERMLDQHMDLCLMHKPQVIVFPEVDKPWECYNKFDKFAATLPFSYVGVWDMECYLKPFQYCAQSASPAVKVEEMHIPFSYELIIYGPDKKIFRRKAYTGDNVVGNFFKTAMRFANVVLRELKRNNKREMTPEEHHEYAAATHCPMCGERFGFERIKVRHHHHQIYFDRVVDDGTQERVQRSNFIAAVCSYCNLQIQEKKQLTLIAHNGARYDWKALLRFMPEEFKGDIKVLAKNTETFYQLIVDKKLRLIDSFKHMPMSLDRLVTDLRSEGLDKFIITKQVFGKYGQDLDLLLRKLPFPYRFFTGPEAHKHVGWCPRHYFDNDLKDEKISNDDWECVKKIFRLTGCRTMGEYSKLYQSLDVSLLADVIINYCSVSHELFGLEPLHFVSLPGYSMACMRYFTRETKLQYFTEPNQMLRTLTAVRGGIQQLVCRLKRANVPNTPEYDVNKPASEICCLDVNQLYCSTFAEKLPTGRYITLPRAELDAIYNGGQVDLSQFGDEWGCFLCVNLRFPSDPAWIKKYMDFPFAPAKWLLSGEDVFGHYPSDSYEYKVHELPTLESYLRQSRLMLTFYPKKSYMVHHEELRLYLAHGVIVEDIVYGYKFEQKPFMKEFLEHVSEFRRACQLETRTAIIKLIMNSIYGKLIMNVFELHNVKIARDSMHALRYLAKPEYKTHYIVNNSMVIFRLARPRIKFKQLYMIGAAVLSYSKIKMWRLYYEHLTPYFEKRMQLLYQDTDSFILFIEYLPGEKSLCKDFQALHCIMDCSNLHENDPAYNILHKGIPGLLKNELKSKKGVAFASYQMKKYILLVFDPYTGKGTKKVASGGVAKYHLEKMEFEKFVDGLFSHDWRMVTERRIVSVQQEVFTIRIRKVFLQNMYLHRRLLRDGIHTEPWGITIPEEQ